MEDEACRRPLSGDLVVESFDYDGRRRVAVYVPPDRPEAIVFAGDGQLISRWGADLEALNLPPTMIVGACRTDDRDEMARIREYSPSFDEERFAAHGECAVDVETGSSGELGPVVTDAGQLHTVEIGIVGERVSGSAAIHNLALAG